MSVTSRNSSSSSKKQEARSKKQEARSKKQEAGSREQAVWIVPSYEAAGSKVGEPGKQGTYLKIRR